MLALFKKNDITAVLGLIIIGFMCKLHTILHPPAWAELDGLSSATFYSFPQLKYLYINYPLVYGICSFVFLLMMSLYLNYVVVEEKLFLRKSYYAAMAFMLYSSFVPSHSIISIPLLSSFCTLIGLSKCMGLAQQQQAKSSIFQIGLSVGVASLLYFPAIAFAILFLFLLFFFRPFTLQALTGYLIGLLTPIYLYGISAYILGYWGRKPFFHLELPLFVTHAYQTLTIAVISICILVYGWFVYNQNRGKLHIALRKKWNGVGLYFVFAVIVGLFSKSFPGTTWVFVVAPFSILLSQSLQSNKEKVNIFTFYFLIIALLVMQWALK